jgi:hypothetical protein
MTQRFNGLSGFVRTSIVKQEKARARADQLLYWIKVLRHPAAASPVRCLWSPLISTSRRRYLTSWQVARKLRDLNNLQALLAVLAALASAPVHRLRATWALLPEKALAKLSELQKLLDSRGGHR